MVVGFSASAVKMGAFENTTGGLPQLREYQEQNLQKRHRAAFQEDAVARVALACIVPV